jgi:hypothetical protein
MPFTDSDIRRSRRESEAEKALSSYLYIEILGSKLQGSKVLCFRATIGSSVT